MLIVGLTGGMASGKSTFCAVWESLGAFVVKADDLAKSLMVNDAEVKAALLAKFGKHTYDAEGNLDRGYLAEEAFAKGRVEELNAIVHPAVYQEIPQLIKQAKELNKAVFLYEAAILLQKGRSSIFDYIIWVEAGKKEQIVRAIKRTNISSKDAEKRLHLQQSLTDVKDMVDKVVHNNSSVDALKQNASLLYHQLVAKADE